MEIGQGKRLLGIALGILLLTTFALANNSYAQVENEGIPAFHDCGLSMWGLDLVQMETIRSGDTAKTVHQEKEIYRCSTVQGNVELIMEQTIVAEIYENMTTKSIIRTQAEVITCVTGRGNVDIIVCDTETPDHDVIPLRNCNVGDEIIFPNYAMRTNTVTKGKIVKTIEMNKFIFFCNINTEPDTGVSVYSQRTEPWAQVASLVEKKVDRVIFTETWEDLSLLPNNPVIKKEALSFICVTVLAEDADGSGGPFGGAREDRPARVESCRFQSLGTLT